ncbi:MAG TPA: hypothetical protein DCM67_12650 [Propionibacteriaceae bacterium]|nr:hypothetical protein [Propionibacteriaceae bacterium]
MMVIALLTCGSLVGSVALIVQGAGRKDSIEHDEGISFINSAGKMSDWMNATAHHVAPVGGWAPATDWQYFWRVGNAFDFGVIAQGLAAWDIHPPLYFWLLHIWSLCFGMTPASSIGLNVLLTVLAGIALFGMARWAFEDTIFAALTVCLWALASPTVGAALVARQYVLLSLVSVLAAWAALAFFTPARRPRVTEMLVVGVAIAAGLLTYYQFALLVAGLMIWLTITCWGRWRHLILLYGSGVIGIMILLVAHPGFTHSLSVLSQANTTHADLNTATRSGRTVAALSRIVCPAFGSPSLGGSWFAPAVVLLLGVVLVAVAVVVAARLGRDGEALAWMPRPRVLALSMLGVWSLALIVILYLTGRSPTHAMADRYLAMVLPFAAFLPLALLRPAGPSRRGGAVIATILVVVLGGISVAGQLQVNATANPNLPVVTALSGARHVVIDSLARGIVPRVLIDAPASLEVYVDRESRLLSDPAAWADRLGSGDVVVSDPSYAESAELRAEFIEELEQRFVVSQLPASGPMQWWRIEARKP